MKPKKSAKKTKGAAKRAARDLTARTSVVGGDKAALVTNLASMKHESLKAVAQNLRA
jgi:hypothetical protein